LGNLFEIVGTKSLDSNAIDFTKTGINFVGRTFENNGVQGKIERRNFEPNEPFTITATVIGNYKYVKYQTEPYYCSQNINKLTPKSIIEKWNEKIAYYLIVSIQKFVSLYDGQQGGYKLEDINNYKIKLPTQNSKIDFDFMESFIADLEAERIADLEAYLLATGLKDYTLTVEEKQVLDDFEQMKFEEFNVIDIFNVKNTGNILSRDIVENSGVTPYLCASAENNAVSSYISYDEKYLDKGNCVFIGGKTFVVTYQEKDFYSNDSHNLVLYLKNEENRNKSNQLYLANCINKSLKHKYSWGDSISNTKIKKDKVSLPTQNNQPNFTIMETFISAIQKLVIKEVVLYADRKIAATKTVVNK
jgi:hypothetical protein